jgi:glycosyltransferase involved in cell wall biosynthesis
MPRVCMIVMSHYPNDERVRRQAEALEREGVPVDIICMRREDQARTDEYGLVKAHRVQSDGPKENLKDYLWLSVKFAIKAFFALQRLSWKCKYNVIQAHNMPNFLVFCAWPQRLAGRPVVLDLHDLTVELFASRWSEEKTKRLGPLLRLEEKISCAFAKRLITTSKGFEERLANRTGRPDKISLVINTPDPHIFTYQEDRQFRPIDRGARLLYHGTIKERFGLVKAIEALAMIQDRIPGSRLDLYGQYDPSYKNELTARIKALGLENQAFLHGWRSLEEIREIIREADIGIVPYLSDDFMNLALSTKTFEYTSCGLPVIASKLRPVTSIFSEDCICFSEPGSAEEIADRIVELCHDPRRRENQSRSAIKALEPMSGAVMIRRYVDLIQNLIKKK